MDSFDYDKLVRAQDVVRRILHTQRVTSLASIVPHTYDDKFGLAEWCTNIAISASLSVLKELGLTRDNTLLLRQWAAEGLAVTLRFDSEEWCEFVREQSREVTTGSFTSAGYFGSKKVERISTITEHVFKITFQWKISLFGGTNVADAIEIRTRRSTINIVQDISRASDPPIPEHNIPPSIDVELAPILFREDPFVIDRTQASCRTPRRNADVDAVLEQSDRLRNWAQCVETYLKSKIFPFEKNLKEDTATPVSASIDAINGLSIRDIFNPVLPIMEKYSDAVPESETKDESEGAVAATAAPGPRPELDRSLTEQVAEQFAIPATDAHAAIEAGDRAEISKAMVTQRERREARAAWIAGPSAVVRDSAPHPLLSNNDTVSFMWEHLRTLRATLAKASKDFPNPTEDQLISSVEATTVLLLQWLRELDRGYVASMYYVEQMLYDQLRRAVGKVLTAKDFDEYMLYHNKRLFKPTFAPGPLVCPITRPDHQPEGVLALEREDSSAPGGHAPLVALSRRVATGAFKFQLNAASVVQMKGPVYAHAAVLQQFTTSASFPSMRLNAQSRQFSSYILMLGTLAPGGELEPKYAITIKDKDDVIIPLCVETIPTPKEFQDAIESLSPEQQRFAKAFRSMQLAGTLFALALVQIKPQMEKVLGLRKGSLTKEVKLTQTLMKLFIEYQISPDQLSVDTEVPDDVGSQLDAVRANVDKFTGMIEQLEAKERAKLRLQALKARFGRLTEEKAKRKAERRARREEREKKRAERRKEKMMNDRLAQDVRTIREQHSQMEMMLDRVTTRMESLDSLVAATNSLSMSATTFGSARPKRKSRFSFFKKKSKIPAPEAAECLSMFSDDCVDDMIVDGDFESKAEVEAAVVPKAEVESKAGAEGEAMADADATGESKAEAEADATGETEGETEDVSEQPDNDVVETVDEDLTTLPKELDAAYLRLDKDSTLRPTTIKVAPGAAWTKSSVQSLLSSPTTSTLDEEALGKERSAAFDLLDALSLSGEISVDCAELHVVVAATHRFARSLVDTVVMDNINPIDKVERSVLIVANTLHRRGDATHMLLPAHVDRVRDHSPELFSSTLLTG